MQGQLKDRAISRPLLKPSHLLRSRAYECFYYFRPIKTIVARL